MRQGRWEAKKPPMLHYMLFTETFEKCLPLLAGFKVKEGDLRRINIGNTLSISRIEI